MHIEHVHLRRGRRIIGMVERTTTENLRQIGPTAVGLEKRMPDGAGLARLAARKNGSSSGIAEQHGTLALSRVEGTGGDLAAANQDIAIDTGGDKVRGGMESNQKAQTGGVDIEAGAGSFRRSQFALQEGRRARDGLLRRCRDQKTANEIAHTQARVF